MRSPRGVRAGADRHCPGRGLGIAEAHAEPVAARPRAQRRGMPKK